MKKTITLCLSLLMMGNVLLAAPLQYQYAVTSRQGDRSYQEDAVYPGSTDLGILPLYRLFFGVFDGHCGGQASQYVTNSNTLAGYLTLGKPVPEMLKIAFAQVESELVGSNPKITDGSGTTATTLYFDINSIPKAYLANVGDSRTIVLRLVRGQYKVVASTIDHKPGSPEERARIERAGGHVEIWGVPRVNGFALSRSLGDADAKEHRPHGLITAEPDIFEVDLQAGDIVIMASDGLWDVMSNNDVCALINGSQPHFDHYYVKRDGTNDNVIEQWGSGTVDKQGVKKIAATNEEPPQVMNFIRNLSETAYRKGSQDNITVMGFEVAGGGGVTGTTYQRNTTPSTLLPTINLKPLINKLVIGGGLLIAAAGFGYWLYKKWHEGNN